MSAVTIDEAWPGFGGPFTVAELDRMPSDGHRYELVDGVLTVACPAEIRVVAEPAPSRIRSR